MTIDEGYVKYRSTWIEASAPDPGAAAELETWRRPLFDAGLIGHYEELGVGFGNLSIRCGGPGQFLISGTQTGHMAQTNENHYSLVTAYDIDANSLRCMGPVQASSEAMTHAAIYELDTRIGAVAHVHSRSLWQRLINRLPTTDPDVAYGTPRMAREFRRLYEESGFRRSGLAVMAGHEEGLVSIGGTLQEAVQKMIALSERESGD